MSGFSFEVFGQLNYWAIVVSGLVAFTIGGLWYSPVLFEGAWMSANDYSQSQVQDNMSSLLPFGFIGAIVIYTLIATVFAFLSHALGAATIVSCILLGLLIWAGFVAPSGFMVVLFSPGTISGWLIDAGFQLTSLLAVGIILGAWR